MRMAKEGDVLRPLKYRKSDVVEPFFLADDTVIDLGNPCTVIGGTNGAGKSRLLRRIHDQPDVKTVLVDLHYLAAQALLVLGDPMNFNALADEAGLFGPDADRRADVERVVRREYESIEWFALDLEPGDPEAAERFRWTGDQPLVPYFRATYRGICYTARNMGLGEFSVHYLFWILEHYKTVEGLMILLDEPDAFLPPVGISSLLPRLIRLCDQRGWRIIISTHSEEMIALAAEHNVFTLLSGNEFGETRATHAFDDRTVLNDVLSRPPTDHALFCEDEVAVVMAGALIEYVDPMLARRTTILWGGKGHGSLRVLQDKLPRPPQSKIRFAYLYDGDQRGKVEASSKDRWPAVFLPTFDDPNSLLKTLSQTPEDLAVRLGVSVNRIRRVLTGLEGMDLHDWVDQFAAEFTRPEVLRVLTTEWARRHTKEAETFVNDLREGWR